MKPIDAAWNLLKAIPVDPETPSGFRGEVSDAHFRESLPNFPLGRHMQTTQHPDYREAGGFGAPAAVLGGERNLRTEKEINLGPASAKHLIPNDYLQAEVEKKRLDNLRAQFPALLKELKEKYEVGDTEINRLTKEGVRNIDSAWHEATAHITDLKPYKFYGDIKRGDELNEIIKMTGSEGIAKRKDYDIKTGQKMFTPELLYRLTKEGEWVDMNHDKNKQLFSDETSLRKDILFSYCY